MADPLKDLRKLTWLARKSDDASRRALLERVTDLFMEAPAGHTAEQKECFGDIMGSLAFALEQEVREELACRIADEIDAPRQLVLRLAHDVISVARPLLERSPTLSQNDLIELARKRSQEHLFAITRRVDIRIRLSAVLCERGGVDVVASLLQNDSADIASATLAQVAERAKSSNALQSALIGRANVPKTVMLDLIDYVSHKLKQELLQRLTEADRTNLDDVIAAFKSQAGSLDDSDVERDVDDLAGRGRLNQYELMRYISRGKFQHFLLGFARLADIGVPDCLRILSDETGTALAVVCRAYGFGAKALKRIAMSPLTSIPDELSKVHELVSTYERLSRENARDAMTHWRKRQSEAPKTAQDVAVPENQLPRAEPKPARHRPRMVRGRRHASMLAAAHA